VAENTLLSIPSIEDMALAIEATKQVMDEDEEFRHELEVGHTSGNPMVLGPRLPSADEWADLQVAGARNNAAKWLARVTKPKKNFKEEALRETSRARYRTSMEQVLAKDLWAGGMALVDESETMATITAGGSAVYTSGVERRKAKIRRRVAELREDRLALCSTIDAMPVGTDTEREAKMIANKRGLQAIGLRRRGA